ncbi:GGDEF domain-containing protein [Leeia sp. TBRC 13508]|uniref:diguanylate cyclase n=1 Tax=Leeia speluncae TaxID=2884804 RepID=A0ABS8D946_9NEIS|nr:GGDEF domain-containing protein [Leeia speluncae]MCB6184699.1 GGDEF domain-containing protein [Leeia speluncae]
MKAPQILDHLIGITGIRDLELLEISLLNTLQELIAPFCLSIDKLDKKSNAVYRLRIAENGAVLEQDELQNESPTGQAIQSLELGNLHTISHIHDGKSITVFKLVESAYERGYLVIKTLKPLTAPDHHFLSGVLGIYKNFCSLLQHAQTDELTGLNNRKTFDEYMSKLQRLTILEPERLQNDQRRPANKRIWLAIADIDHFKSVNDRFGHLYGDEVLVLFAQVLKNKFRTEDMIFRFGGEEFIVILRCPDLASCELALNRFKNEVAQKAFPQVGQVTVSIGAVELDPNTFSATQLDYADKALYHSKQNGRDCVTFFESMLANGIAYKNEFKEGEISLF